MKKFFIICLPLMLLIPPVFSQFYLRGKVVDANNAALSNVQLLCLSNGAKAKSGFDGSFGISIPNASDTLRFVLPGYERKDTLLSASKHQVIILSKSDNTNTKTKELFTNITDNYKAGLLNGFFNGGETYAPMVENSFITAADYPTTAFSLAVNKASYSNARRFITSGTLVPPDAVRVEDFINYFNLDYAKPAEGKTFSIRSEITECPWNDKARLLYLNISSKPLDFEKAPPANFTFLVDISASMDMPNRLPVIKDAFKKFVQTMRNKDRISIVVYGGNVGVYLPVSGCDKKDKIIAAIDSLQPGGNTPGESAIQTAYKLAETTFISNGNNRVIIATDGDFNVGESSDAALETLISRYRETGIYLTCLGVGMGNLKDSKLEVLARKGNGNYGYIDNIHEAEKFLIKELSQNLFSVADNVSMQLNFTKQLVKQYRLVGFDNKVQAIKDGTGELDGGEIGGGVSTIALVEFIPADNKAIVQSDKICDLLLMYKEPASDKLFSEKLSIGNCFNILPQITSDQRLAIALAFFAMKLKNSPHAEKADWTALQAFLAEIKLTEPEQSDFLQLVNRAEEIYDPAGFKKRMTKIKKAKGK